MPKHEIIKPILKTPEFKVKHWIDANGKKIEPLIFSDFEGKFKVIYCFQSWCAGCHSKGFPDLKKISEALEGEPQVVFIAIQTVFEGFDENTYDKIEKTQKQYNLKIPFGHDAGDDGKSLSNIMSNYQTRGTPWFIFINQKDHIIFADFHLNVEAVISFLKTIK